MTAITAHEASDSGAVEPRWIKWASIGFLGFNILLLVLAFAFWRSRNPAGEVVESEPVSVAVSTTTEQDASAVDTQPEAAEASPAMAPALNAAKAGAEMESSMAGETTAIARGVIKGQILLQGRQSHEGVTILLNGKPVAKTDAQGTFRIEAVPAGTYTLAAQHPGSLPLQLEAIEIREGTITLPTISLRSGDLDGDGDIDIFDLVRYASNPGATDVNGDGKVNVRDLLTLDLNYGATGPDQWR